MSTNPHILICDDDPVVHESLGLYLENEHFSYSSAFDGKEALAHVASDRPDLIILDLMMPEKPGKHLSQETFDALHTVFARNGLEIACDLKRALPDWTVVYFDESKLTGNKDQPRAEFEYEITAEFAATWVTPRLDGGGSVSTGE